MEVGWCLKGRGPDPDPIRLVLCDEYTLFRQALHCLLTPEIDLLVVGEAKLDPESLSQVCALCPKVTIVSFHSLNRGLETISHLRTLLPETGIIALVNDARSHELAAVLEAGAQCCLSKGASSEMLLWCIRQVALGKTPLSKADMDDLLNVLEQHESRLPELKKGQLGRRELALLKLVAQGATNDEIAQALSISNKTVRNYLSDLYATLRVENRTKAALYALQVGIVSLGGE